MVTFSDTVLYIPFNVNFFSSLHANIDFALCLLFCCKIAVSFPSEKVAI